MYGAYGIHPLYSYEYTEEEERKKIEAMSNPKTVAWGEIGLDYHDFGSKYSYATPEQQKPGIFLNIFLNYQYCIIIFVASTLFVQRIFSIPTARIFSIPTIMIILML